MLNVDKKDSSTTQVTLNFYAATNKPAESVSVAPLDGSSNPVVGVGGRPVVSRQGGI